MKRKKIYMRKKGKCYIIEGISHGKKVFIWQIPKDYENFLKKLIKRSFFTQGKAEKIKTILDCLDYRRKNA